MGNQKSLYKTYFNEVYLKRGEEGHLKHKNRPQTGNDNQSMSGGGGSSSRQTPDSQIGTSTVGANGGGNSSITGSGGNTVCTASQISNYYKNGGAAVVRATADMALTANRWPSGYQRNQKTFKVTIDNNYNITISVPEKLPPPEDDPSMPGELPTCGWLLEQVAKKYAQLIKEQKQNNNSSTKLRKKLIVALKTVDKNETIDFWLTQYSRPLKVLPNGLVLEPHFSKIIKNKPKAVCTNDFELLKVIGKGGFSKVYMVRKKDTGLIYAMKVMKKEGVTNDSKLKQIMNERTIMEQLGDHPFVVKLHYAFQSKENLHFIIDFCTGGEMFYHLSQNARFPEFLSKFYFAEILLGIEYLHEKNIVYRDLKPENVLIDVDGHVKVADFGLSKIFKRDERSFSYCGSPEYMCPEILKREGHNHMVDYYTLGAILYEMLTGFPPFYTNNKCEMTKRILESDLTFNQNLNPQAVDLMRKLLERNPMNRLGAQRGVEEIKQHEWCQDIDWEAFKVKKIVPPWKPRMDSSNFDPEYTQLPLNFDESNFKRALQGDREFSIYLESPCQSLTVTEHSIYASNPDLTNSTNAELLLQSGSSKQLLEHFFNQQQPPHAYERSVLSPREFADIIQQQKIQLQMNTEMALRINQSLIRDESKISLEYNQELGLTNFRGFSFYGESNEEREVKSQLIKYTKLRNKLNKRLKRIQDEDGVIRSRRLKDIELSTPSSSLSSQYGTVLPTPPVVDDGGSSRNSIPSSYYQQSNKQAILQNQPQHESFASNSVHSGLSMSGVNHNKVIDKKSKQQMIIAKLGKQYQANNLYKSFQPGENKNTAGIVGGIEYGGQDKASVEKKNDLFRSNIEHVNHQDLLGHSHKEYLNDSIRDMSSDDNESVAEEREFQEESATIHQTNPHQIMNSGLDLYQQSYSVLNKSIEESKEGSSPQIAQTPVEQIEELKESLTPLEYIHQSHQEAHLNNVKFILFQQQNVAKNKPNNKAADLSKNKVTKLIVTQRSRMHQSNNSNKRDEHQVNGSSSTISNGNINSMGTKDLSGSGTTGKLRFQLATTGGGTSIHQNSSSSQAMTSSRDHHQNTGDTMIAAAGTYVNNHSEKTPEQVNSTHGAAGESGLKNEEQMSNNNDNELDKTASIINLHDKNSQSQVKKLRISPRKAKNEQFSTTAKKSYVTFKKKNLEIDTLQSPEIRSKMHSKKASIACDHDFMLANISEIDEFKIIKKFPQTMKAADQKRGGFNFDFSGTENPTDASQKETPKHLSGLSASGGTQFQASSQSTVSKLATKKISMHQKQISADFNLHLMMSNDLAVRLGHQQEAKNRQKGQIQQPSPQMKFSGLPQFEIEIDQSGEIQTDMQLFRGSTFTTCQMASKKPTKNISNIKTCLKRGITTTASTVGLGQSTTQQPKQIIASSKAAPEVSKTNKPPLNFKTQSTFDQTSQSSALGGKKFLNQGSSGVYGKTTINSAAGTPSNKTIGQLSKNVPHPTAPILSQPSSAKNSHSNKFTFPTATISIDHLQSPTKKLPSQSSFKSQGLKSVKGKPQQPTLSQLKSQERLQLDHKQENGDTEEFLKPNTKPLSKEDPMGNKGFITQSLLQTATLVRPPMTTKNSQSKGFFQ